jgi:signal transduction histidine kinase
MQNADARALNARVCAKDIRSYFILPHSSLKPMALTFRARLTLWYVTALVCLLALTAAGLIYTLWRVAQQKFDAALWMVGATEAENVAARLRARGVERPDSEAVSNTRYRELLGYGDGPLEKYVTVVDDASAAEAVNAHTLKSRLPELDTHDALGRLVRVFNQMLARLDAAFEGQRRFTSRAAHELRTPLTILKGEAQVALGRRRTIGEYESLLRSSLEEIDKLVEIIDDLLLLARYEGGEADIPREAVALHRIVRSVAEQLRPIARHKEIELSVEAEECYVEGKARALERMVCKLMENAVFYTPRGGRVRACLARADGQTTLSVEDTGIGIAPEELAHIFDRFFRAPAAREMRPEGSEIGLAMVSTIARLHGATIDMSSRKGSGSRFTVNFSRDAAARGADG